MSETNTTHGAASAASDERDDVLFAFHRYVSNPKPFEVTWWTRHFPQFADDIRETTVEVIDMNARVKSTSTPAGAAGDPAETDALVDRFATALKAKFRASEAKYGWQNGWLKDGWEADCQRDLARHITKGDPLDVAAYAAFCWHHGWPTWAPRNHSDETTGAVAPSLEGEAAYQARFPGAPLSDCPDWAIDAWNRVALAAISARDAGEAAESDQTSAIALEAWRQLKPCPSDESDALCSFPSCNCAVQRLAYSSPRSTAVPAACGTSELVTHAMIQAGRYAANLSDGTLAGIYQAMHSASCPTAPVVSDGKTAEARDDVLFAFNRYVNNPTPFEVTWWTRHFPQYADDIRGHAVEVIDMNARVEATEATPQAENAGLREAFGRADDDDWARLDAMVGHSGHGKFWRSVFNEVRAILGRAALSRPQDRPAADPVGEAEPDADRLLKDALFACLKTGCESKGYSGVQIGEGRYARIKFWKEDTTRPAQAPASAGREEIAQIIRRSRRTDTPWQIADLILQLQAALAPAAQPDRASREEIARIIRDHVYISTDLAGIISDAILAARLNPEPVAGWQDISTAPKDQSALLLACADWPHSTHIGKPVPVKVGGWHLEHRQWQIFGASWVPTHWMPLPAAPTPASGAESGRTGS